MDAHEVFFRSLSQEEMHLIALKEFLYDGSWEEISADLRARKAGKPHVFKLETRIDEDLDRIERLLRYEREEGVNLGDYLYLYKESRAGNS